jgi:hypothetical protein
MNYSEFYISFRGVGRLDSTVLDGLDEFFVDMIKESRNKHKLLMIWRYASESCFDYMNIEYNTLIKDFTDYLDCTVNNQRVKEDNIFAIICKRDWENTPKAKVIVEYMNTLQANNPSKEIKYVLLPNGDVPEKPFRYKNGFLVWKYFPPYRYVINIDKKYFPVYIKVKYEFCDERVFVTNAKEQLDYVKTILGIYNNYIYAKSLDKLLEYNFINIEQEILIILCYSAPVLTYFTLDEPEELLDYEIYRKYLSEYFDNRVTNNPPLFNGNHFEDVNRAWYDCSKENYFRNLDRDCFHSSKEGVVKYHSIRYGRQLIDEYMNKLNFLYPNKNFRYLVLPSENNHYPYLIL